MARNVEIKARLGSIEALLPVVSRLADSGPDIIHQDDTFFACPNGRLKLRVFADRTGELIFYRRPDAPGPKLSEYTVAPVADPAALRQVLEQAYGRTARVRKRRILFLAGQTRVHLDDVEGLGHFLELEVVLGDDQPAEDGVRIARDLLDRLGVAIESLVQGAYADLLSARSVPGRPDGEASGS